MNCFLDEELSNYADVYIATEDGSVGTKGNVLDAIKAHGLKADVIFACGPTPMLRALKAYAEEEGIECWLSSRGADGLRCGSMSWHVSASPRKLTTIPRYTTSVSARTDRYFLSTEVDI